MDERKRHDKNRIKMEKKWKKGNRINEKKQQLSNERKNKGEKEDKI